ncbi:CvpA family protein [Arenibacter sp. 6A1]|uniref:CvpA family protein n=1 Tax=Arenibacter sp. 6A1 TaxID=2720391 RepID=UPI0014460B1C|nr:CvpA family protein [Arenibacter sp. 6A1]NKI26498.1 CvpA family protein [Arenibacter sp. 6A1]
MGTVDIILGLLLLYGLYKGFKNGLFVEIASLIALIAGLYGAFHFSYITGEYLGERMDWNEKYINTASFIITFILIVVLVNIIGKLLTKIADFAMLGFLNKMAGGIFGALKVAIIIGALLIFFDKSNNQLGFVKEDTILESKLYTPVKDIGELVFSKVLKHADQLEDSPVEKETMPATEARGHY